MAAYWLCPNDTPDAEDLAVLEAEHRAATIDPDPAPRACVDHLAPGLLCSVCWTDHKAAS